MSTANIFVRKIANGFVVGYGTQDLLGCGVGEQYFPTLPHIKDAIGDIIETALATAAENERQIAAERAQYAGNRMTAAGVVGRIGN